MILYVHVIGAGRNDSDRAIPIEAVHPVVIAAERVDHSGRTTGSFEMIVRPENWRLDDGLAVSQMLADRAGVRLRSVLALLKDLADGSDTVVAHDVERVVAVIAAARRRLGGSPAWVRQGARLTCTARPAAALCRLPKPGSEADDDWRLPTMAEATAEIVGAADDSVAGLRALHAALKAKGMEIAA